MTQNTFSLSTSAARDRLPQVILRVQDPRASVILTRYGKPVAAVVSMAELQRIWSEQDIEDMLANRAPSDWMVRGMRQSGMATPHEAAEHVRQVQMDRKAEREVLEFSGMAPVDGGELGVEMEEVVVGRKRWLGWFGLGRKTTLL